MINEEKIEKEKEFMIQWHITNKCDKNCGHCYMTLEERTNNSDELTTDQAKTVIDDLVEFTKVAKVKPVIYFTGGNPLLRENFKEILEYTNEKQVIINILGNPTPLTDKNIEMLIKNNIRRYQLSFDGLKTIHDELRGKGSFDEGIKGIEILRKANIPVVIMSTVTKQNQYDLPKLARKVMSHGANRFDFSRLVPIGNGKDLKDLTFTSKEYKIFLYRMYEEYKKMIIEEGIPAKALGTKDPLWSLLLYEKGLLKLPENKKLIYTGCSVAKNGFCMEPDGSIYGCRRMPIKIANIKDIKIRNFFFNNKEMNEYRNVKKIEACNDCELIPVCRGCRAVAWAKTKSYFGRDPQCWK
jgi:radical SAM protein with 4Fe4S-binding SPASM domain